MTDKTILDRIKRNAEAALRATKSARTRDDVPRFIQQVIDGLAVEMALTSDQPNIGVDVGKLVDRFLAWPVPPEVCSDLCMTDAKYKFPRSGTCIMGPREARIMFEHCLFPIMKPQA